MSHKRAAIDVGTNSFLLTIAEVDEGYVTQVYEEHLRFVRLGEGFGSAKIIREPAILRAIDALRFFRERCIYHNIPLHQVRAAGTSAVREATNGRTFVEQMHQETGLHIQRTPGEREAYLSWLGSLSNLNLPSPENAALIDIGGGSTEFMWDNGQKARSFPLGVVKGFERHLHQDPPTSSEQEALANEAIALWKQLPDFPTPSPLIAVAGTATTLSAVAQKLNEYDGERIHGSRLTRSELQQQIERYSSMETKHRKQIPGLPPERADVILAGAILLETAMKTLGVTEVLISDRGIRYGLLLASD